MATIELMPVEEAVDEVAVGTVADLVNLAYAIAEEGLWRPGIS